MILITVIINCIIIHSKCLRQTAQGWGSVLKNEVGEVGKVQIMKGSAEQEVGNGGLFQSFIKGSLKQEKTTQLSTSERLLAPGVEF